MIWLCRSKAKDRFEIYLADGLKNDLKFEATIRSQIETRGFKTEIERRMLHSIQRSIATSGIARRKVIGSKRLPSLETIMRELGMGDLGYDVVQRMGSHHVHGTWTTLLSHNIEKNDPMLPIKGEFNPPHPNQLMFGSMIVLEGILAFVECVIRRSDRGKVIKVIEAYRTSLMKHNDMMAHKDWQPASKDIEGARGSRVTR